MPIDLRESTAGPGSDITVVEPAPLVIPGPRRVHRPQHRRRSPVVPVALGAGLAVLGGLPIVLTATRLGLPFSHVADVALIDLQARRLPEDLPLLGAYSRFGWRHPGPLATYLFAGGQALTGGSPRAVFLTALTVNIACVAAIGAILRRLLGSGPALAGIAVLGGWAVLIRPAHLLSPWGPHAVILPVALLLVSLAAVLAGRWWCLPVATVAGTLLVQTHVGLAIPVAGVALATLAGVAARRLLLRRRHAGAPPRGRARVAVPVSVVLALVLWVPPLVEQVQGDPGNLTRLADFAGDARRRDDTGHPAGDALDGVLRGMAGPLPGGVEGRWVLPAAATAGTLALVLAVLVGRRRRGDGPAAATAPGSLVVLGWLAVGLAVLSATQVVGDLYGYLFVWTSAAAVSVVLGGAVAAAVRWPGLRFVSIGALVVLGLLLARQYAGDDGASYRSAPGVAALSEEADRTLRAAGAESVLVDITGGEAWTKAVGIALELDRQGYEVRLERAWARVFDPDLADTGRTDACVVVEDVGRGATPLASVDAAEVVIARGTAVAVLPEADCPGPGQEPAGSETPTPPLVPAP